MILLNTPENCNQCWELYQKKYDESEKGMPISTFYCWFKAYCLYKGYYLEASPGSPNFIKTQRRVFKEAEDLRGQCDALFDYFYPEEANAKC